MQYNNYNPYNPYTYVPQQNYNQQPGAQLIYVNGIESARSYIVEPNRTIYMRDSESNRLYEKTTDNQGRPTMKVYELKELTKDEPKQADYKTLYEELNKRLTELETSVNGAKKEM